MHSGFLFKLFLLYFMDVFSRGINSVSFTQAVFAQSKVTIYSTHMEIILLFKCSFFNHISLDLKPNYILLSLISPRYQVFCSLRAKWCSFTPKNTLFIYFIICTYSFLKSCCFSLLVQMNLDILLLDDSLYGQEILKFPKNFKRLKYFPKLLFTI